MHKQESWSAEKVVLTFVAIVFVLVSGAWGASEQVLYNFTGAPTGMYPLASLVFDGAGNLYGTTADGGNDKACPSSGCGVVFELVPAAGGWTETVIHTFSRRDGAYPAAHLVFDHAGNLYGTTQFGGKNDMGVVFELTPATGGGWTEKVLHSFTSGYDGGQPAAGLAIDAAGNLYGTTEYGGARSKGVAFELLPTSTGWKHKVLHSFGAHGVRPIGGLVLDQAGNLYGTTSEGGNREGHGLVFELTPKASGPWNEIVLYKFQGQPDGGKDGTDPMADLNFDGQGNLYGTTYRGGTHHGRGVIFKLTPSSGGTWTNTILHYAGRKGGCRYRSGLIFDNAGNLYGTATFGGGIGGGVVFRLTPTTSGFWKETVLHSFGGTEDGTEPVGGLVFDTAGNLYGTTVYGGTGGDGTLFEVTR